MDHSNPILHTYHDGSTLRLTSAKALIQIPIWKGNRVKDSSHVAALKSAVGAAVQNLDKGYHVIKYKETDAAGTAVEQAYIIDGQHRATVLADYFASTLCEPDFPVTYTEIVVNNEAEAIEYFNRINNAKPIHYKEDPVLIANRYIEKLVKAFPGTKTAPLFRDKATHRPYIQTEKLRELLIVNVDKIKCTADVFVERAAVKNKKMLDELDLAEVAGHIKEKDKGIITKARELRFALGVDAHMAWFHDVVGAKN